MICKTKSRAVFSNDNQRTNLECKVGTNKPASCLPHYARKSRRVSIPNHTPPTRRDTLFPKDAIDMTAWFEDAIALVACATTVAIWMILIFAVTP